MTRREFGGSNPMRVAMICRYCPHWRAPMFARLNAEPDIHFVVFHGQTIPGTKIVNGDRMVGFEHKAHFTLHGNVKAGGRTTPWVLFPTVFWSLVRYKPDVIIAEGGSNVLTNVLVYVYATLWRKPVVWWTLGILPGREFRGIRKLYRRVVVAMERRATALLGYSSVALAYFKWMGYPAQKCFRAVNCVDTDRVFAEISRGKEQVADLRTKLGLDGKRVVLFVGALVIEKEIHRLLHAFVRIRHAVPDSRLLIVGDGTDRPRLEGLAVELGISSDTSLVGRVVEGVSNYYELGDVFVMPGLGGLVVSEAMAHGLPVICSQGDGCEVDLVRNDESGYRFGKLDDEEATELIANHVIRMLSDEGRLRRMSEAAHRIIAEEHNVNTYVAHVADSLRFAATGVRASALVDPFLPPDIGTLGGGLSSAKENSTGR